MQLFSLTPALFLQPESAVACDANLCVPGDHCWSPRHQERLPASAVCQRLRTAANRQFKNGHGLHRLLLVELDHRVGCTAPMLGLMVRDGLFLTGPSHPWQPRPGRPDILEPVQATLGLARDESILGRPRPTTAPSRATGRAISPRASEAAAPWAL